jgi:hypothetical protein
MRHTVGSLAVQKGGLRNGWKVIRIITGWAFCWQELGHQPSVTEYIEWADSPGGTSRATSYRDLAEFRKVFDKCEDPSPIVAEARRKIAAKGLSRLEGAAVVVGLPI